MGVGAACRKRQERGGGRLGLDIALVCSAIGIWAVFGSGMIAGGGWVIGGALVLIYGSVAVRGGRVGVVTCFAAGVVAGFWFFNSQAGGADLMFHLSPPNLQQNLLILFTVVFLMGAAVRGSHPWGGRFVILSLVLGVSAGTAIFFKPDSIILERRHVTVGEEGIITSDRSFYILEDEEGQVYASLPGGADTPWVLWSSLGKNGLQCKHGMRLVGEFGKGSKFLPVKNGKSKIPLWTYIGGDGGGGVSPLTAVWTPLLNYGKL
jgi:hypothetical protein